MTRIICNWLCVWVLIAHAAAALVPALAGPVPAPVLQHTCPDPAIRSVVACPDPAAMARGAPWKCTHDYRIDRCAL